MDNEKTKELIHIMHRIMRYTHSKENFGNIPRGEFITMNIISNFYRDNKDFGVKGITVTKIAEIHNIAIANVSRMLRNIEKKGYIERISDDDDRRVVYIRLSPKGEDIIQNARVKTEERFSGLFGKLGEKDLAEYFRLSRNLYQIIRDEKFISSDEDKGKGNNI